MKTSKLILFSLLLMAMISSCLNTTRVSPSRNVTTLNKSISDYKGLEISSAFTVDVQYSPTDESIEIEANENLHQYIEVEKVNDLLRIRIQNGVNISGNSTLRAHIITNDVLDYFSASGASIITLTDPLAADEVTINLSGASNFIGSVTSNSINAYIEGASNANLDGSTESLFANVSGASTIRDYDMVVNDATIQLSGASQGSLTINGAIDVTASGASILRYKGTGSITDINVSGASQVIKVN